jgi:hypothetical protein
MFTGVDWLDRVFQLIDVRSFSNVWYWMALAVVWSSASHFVLGVPFDMVQRASRRGGQAERDFEDMVRISVNRMGHLDEAGGARLLAVASFLLTTLGVLGFYYRVEFAQAVFLIVTPLSLVGFITLREARRLARHPLTGEPLRRRLMRTRQLIQVLGMFAILTATMWGMYQNLVFNPLAR